MLADVEQRADVWMLKRGDCSRFAFEPTTPIRPIDEVPGKDFDGYWAIQARISRGIDLAHPADANQRANFVRAKPGTG
jgi:hypothetical protein